MVNTAICQWWVIERDRVVRNAVESKNAQFAWFELSRLYLDLSEKEKEDVISVLIDWIKSDDVEKRSDAIWLVREHKILAAEPALMELCRRLKNCNIPDDPKGYHEFQKVVKVLQLLGEEGKKLNDE